MINAGPFQKCKECFNDPKIKEWTEYPTVLVSMFLKIIKRNYAHIFSKVNAESNHFFNHLKAVKFCSIQLSFNH